MLYGLYTWWPQEESNDSVIKGEEGERIGEIFNMRMGEGGMWMDEDEEQSSRRSDG